MVRFRGSAGPRHPVGGVAQAVSGILAGVGQNSSLSSTAGVLAGEDQKSPPSFTASSSSCSDRGTFGLQSYVRRVSVSSVAFARPAACRPTCH